MKDKDKFSIINWSTFLIFIPNLITTAICYNFISGIPLVIVSLILNAICWFVFIYQSDQVFFLKMVDGVFKGLKMNKGVPRKFKLALKDINHAKIDVNDFGEVSTLINFRKLRLHVRLGHLNAIQKDVPQSFFELMMKERKRLVWGHMSKYQIDLMKERISK